MAQRLQEAAIEPRGAALWPGTNPTVPPSVP